MSTETVQLLIPELILLAAATLVYVVGAFIQAPRLWGWVAVGALLLAAVALFTQHGGSNGAAADALNAVRTQGQISVDSAGAVDAFGQFVRWLALIAGIGLMLMFSRPSAGVQAPEIVGTLLLALVGLMLVAAGRELTLLFVGLELISIPTYVLLYLGRRGGGSREATAKYFFLSILSSALTLYGFSFLYGVGRSTYLPAIQQAFAAETFRAGALAPLGTIAMLLMVAGLGFKIAAVPFHFYAPDVYQGTTNGNAGVLSVLPKAAGFVVLVRILLVAMPGLESLGWRVALILAVLTMTLGNVLALWQDDVRRLLAYSSIAHAGYMLIGLSAAFASAAGGGTPSFDGVAALLFYLAVYSLATTGTFAALTYLGGEGRQVDRVDELAGLARSHPISALSLAIFMFSLSGIPPLAGFWGKFTLFGSALSLPGDLAAGSAHLWLLVLAVIGALNAAVAAAYYLRIVATMYFSPAAVRPAAQGGLGAAAAMVFFTLLIVGLGLLPGPLVSHCGDASRSLHEMPAGLQSAIHEEQAPAGPPAGGRRVGDPSYKLQTAIHGEQVPAGPPVALRR